MAIWLASHARQDVRTFIRGTDPTASDCTQQHSLGGVMREGGFVTFFLELIMCALNLAEAHVISLVCLHISTMDCLGLFENTVWDPLKVFVPQKLWWHKCHHIHKNLSFRFPDHFMNVFFGAFSKLLCRFGNLACDLWWTFPWLASHSFGSWFYAFTDNPVQVCVPDVPTVPDILGIKRWDGTNLWQVKPHCKTVNIFTWVNKRLHRSV